MAFLYYPESTLKETEASAQRRCRRSEAGPAHDRGLQAALAVFAAMAVFVTPVGAQTTTATTATTTTGTLTTTTTTTTITTLYIAVNECPDGPLFNYGEVVPGVKPIPTSKIAKVDEVENAAACAKLCNDVGGTCAAFSYRVSSKRLNGFTVPESALIKHLSGVATAQACLDECEGRSACKSFAFREDGGKCRLGSSGSTDTSEWTASAAFVYYVTHDGVSSTTTTTTTTSATDTVSSTTTPGLNII
eukprot:gene4598-16594_t